MEGTECCVGLLFAALDLYTDLLGIVYLSSLMTIEYQIRIVEGKMALLCLFYIILNLFWASGVEV